MATLPISRGPSARTVLQIDQPTPGQHLVAELVGVPEQLVAAADGQDDRPARGRGVEAIALEPGQVGGAQLLVAVLAAADVVEVGAVGVQRAPRGRWRVSAKPMPRQRHRRSSSSRLPRSA